MTKRFSVKMPFVFFLLSRFRFPRTCMVICTSVWLAWSWFQFLTATVCFVYLMKMGARWAALLWSGHTHTHIAAMSGHVHVCVFMCVVRRIEQAETPHCLQLSALRGENTHVWSSWIKQPWSTERAKPATKKSTILLRLHGAKMAARRKSVDTRTVPMKRSGSRESHGPRNQPKSSRDWTSTSRGRAEKREVRWPAFFLFSRYWDRRHPVSLLC